MLGKKRIYVDTDGRVTVTEKFISEDVLISLDRAASLKLAYEILRVQGVPMPMQGETIAAKTERS